MTQCIVEPLSRRKIDNTFCFTVRTREEMGECHGLTYPDRNEIQIREDVYNRACEESGRDRLTMAHELFHLLQHEKENVSFARIGKSEKIALFRDPEWQSDAFGGELLIPHHLISGMCAEEIAEKCKVSLAAAKCQMKKQ